jgi:hypothetical protein
MMLVLFLGVGGIGFYTWRVNANFLEDFGARLTALPHTLHNTIIGWIGPPGAGDFRLESDQQTTRHDQSTGFSGKVEPTTAAVLPTQELPVESRDSRLVSEQTEVASKGTTSSTGGHGGNEAEVVATTPEGVGWREKPITVQPGSTVAEIAANIYGPQRNLGLDLIKEYNTHIENLNRIIAGQKLWIPPLSRETLVRQQPDGSYNLILASFRNPQQSSQMVQIARSTGYDVVVTARRVSNDLVLYRVEIGGLKTLDAVTQAWEVASANQWIAFAENSSGTRF